MLNKLVDHVANEAGLSREQAQAALGVVLNAADRQGAEIAEKIFTSIPGARTLAAQSGASVGAATGLIARMIERTPGGRAEVAFKMVRDLQVAGLGHAQIAGLPGAIAVFAQRHLGLRVEGHLGDFLGASQALDAVSAA